MSVGAVILAGGKGTRSANPHLPKLGQVVGGKSLLEWHLDLLQESVIREVVIVAGHLGDQVATLAEEISSFQENSTFNVRVIHETDPRGTVNALKLGVDSLPISIEHFLVMLGDVLVVMPVTHFIDNWRISDKGVGVVAHPNTHPFDSDSVFVNPTGQAIALPKGSVKERVPNSASAGLFVITREAVSRYSEVRDFGSDLLAAAAAENNLFVYTDSHYLKDTGTPERLAATIKDFEEGVIHRRGSSHLRAALFLDRDGVINPVQPEVYRADDYQVLPGVAREVKKANELGIPVFVVTNQPGIAKGHMTFEEHFEIQSELDAQLGAEQAFVDHYYICPHHPESGFPGEIEALKVECDCRKPRNGLASRIALDHGIDLSKSIMVGDTARDQGFAEKSNMGFVHVSTGCDLECPHVCKVDSVTAIRWAIEELAC